jgi:hypothetical protein
MESRCHACSLDLNTVQNPLLSERNEQGRSFLASADILCLILYFQVRRLNEDSRHR